MTSKLMKLAIRLCRDLQLATNLFIPDILRSVSVTQPSVSKWERLTGSLWDEASCRRRLQQRAKMPAPRGIIRLPETGQLLNNLSVGGQPGAVTVAIAQS